VVLAAASVILSLTVWVELSHGPRTIVAASPAVDPPATRGRTEFGDTAITFSALASYDEIVERPLFTSTRRPPSPEPAPPAAPLPTPPPRAPAELALVGIVIQPTQTVALIQDKRVNEVVSATVGTAVAGWEVLEITEDRVRIRYGNQEVTLTLYLPAEEQPSHRPRGRP
jgi:hypothetical protein